MTFKSLSRVKNAVTRINQGVRACVEVRKASKTVIPKPKIKKETKKP